jgi:hypothetical protein
MVAQMLLKEVGRQPVSRGYASRSLYHSRGGVSTRSLDEHNTKAAQTNILFLRERGCTVQTVCKCDFSRQVFRKELIFLK